jgi:hypothetical protein
MKNRKRSSNLIITTSLKKQSWHSKKNLLHIKVFYFDLYARSLIISCVIFR